MKLGVQPDRVLLPMLNDRMVAKGLILAYATTFFSDFLSTEPIDDLVAVLRKVMRRRMSPSGALPLSVRNMSFRVYSGFSELSTQKITT